MEEQRIGKKIRTPRSHSTREMYTYYLQKTPIMEKNDKLPYWMFKEVIARFNKKSADAVIFGQALNFGSRIGHLLIKKIRRNYDKPVVDWGESKRLKAEILERGGQIQDDQHPQGEGWLVYYSDPWYLRWGWKKKTICRVKNQTVYCFKPTANRSKKANDNSLSKLGNRGKLALMNKLNPSLHLLYSNYLSKIEN